MLKNKKILLVLLIIVIIAVMCVFTGCRDMIEKQQKYFYDDELLIKNGDDCTNINMLSNASVKSNKANFSFSCGKFNGKDFLVSLQTQTNKEITIDIDLNIESGKYKFCLISPNNEVTIIADERVDESITINLSAGKSRLVMVGVDAKYSLKLNIKKHEGVVLRRL